ncbi:MAG: Gfo/Idh/MocA family oxidoreductase, partial [Clostridia bacterium]|nr:Gfo/Idh/MocA family oxidoreductase [Clostridia bacterium]
MKKRFVIAGTSSRGLSSYGRPLTELKKEYTPVNQFGYGDEASDKDAIAQSSELVAVFDINIGRAEYVGNELGVPAYDNFDKMLEEQKPDCIIVTTADYAHAEYIVRGLDGGYEVWSEKPMCITA